MAATRTPGITIAADGNYYVDKRHHGEPICLRLGPTTLEQAELRLKREVAHVEMELARRAHARPLFRDCAGRYLAQRHERRSLATMQVHVRLLLPHVGDLEPYQVHDATLAPFVASRVAAGASATTINRSLEIVRAILNRAARSYRDADGTPCLTGVPPLITMLPESRRAPYPITWAEQDRLFPRLPPHLQRMALFAINTGLRDNNVCGLQWTWEAPLPELGRSVFVVPSEAFKGKRDHVVVLNDAAWSIVQAQRGLHPIWVFPFRGHRIDSMNNTGWQNARRAVGLRQMRVHGLRHTFACRLRAAGVTAEDRSALLGHPEHSMSGHYASADAGRLLRLANLVLDRQESCTVLRVANGWPVEPAESACG
ncbi:MAG: tyrosine-type recombinase/integrase [Burkholderiaceae bacterium]|nr:tyrosine-type recombinase/integrase [Burkholderiaceae bacterium]